MVKVIDRGELVARQSQELELGVGDERGRVESRDIVARQDDLLKLGEHF